MSVPTISKEELKQRLEGDPANRPLIVDVRLKYPYEHSTVTLPGAVRMGPGHVEVCALARDREIVLYDSDPGELVSTPLAQQLIGQGLRAVVLLGGIADWMNAKYPIESKTAPQSQPPAPGALKG